MLSALCAPELPRHRLSEAEVTELQVQAEVQDNVEALQSGCEVPISSILSALLGL